MSCGGETWVGLKAEVSIIIRLYIGHMRLMTVYVSCNTMMTVLRNTGSNDEEDTRTLYPLNEINDI